MQLKVSSRSIIPVIPTPQQTVLDAELVPLLEESSYIPPAADCGMCRGQGCMSVGLLRSKDGSQDRICELHIMYIAVPANSPACT